MKKLCCKSSYVKWLAVANCVEAEEMKEDVAEGLDSV